MKTGVQAVGVAVLLVAFTSGGTVNAGVDAQQWQTGTLIAAEMSGHGPDPAGKTASSRRWDVWWRYCLSAGDQTYSAVGRVRPTSMGLKIHGPVRFSVSRDRVVILSSRGRSYTLRLANQKGCR